MKKIGQRHRKHLRALFFDSHPSVLNFSSLDFLGLLKSDFVRKTAFDYVLRWGAGSLPSRPLAPFQERAREIEAKLASLLNMEAALLLESHTDLFSQVIHSIIQPHSILLKSRNFSFTHKGPQEIYLFDASRRAPLENALMQKEHCIVLIDSFEANLGGLQNFQTLIDLANAAGATVIVDDTLSFGMLGKNSTGLSSGISGIDLILGNFGKSFGSYASYLACSKHFMNYIFYHNPFLHRLTPIPPLLLGAVDASLHLIPSLHLERREIFEKGKEIASLLEKEQAFHLLSLPFTSSEERKTFQRHLTEHNCLSLVLGGHLQFSITHSHTKSQLQSLADILKTHKHFHPCEAL